VTPSLPDLVYSKRLRLLPSRRGVRSTPCCRSERSPSCVVGGGSALTRSMVVRRMLSTKASQAARLAAARLPLSAGAAVRHLNLHEYQSAAIMREHGVTTPKGECAPYRQQNNLFLSLLSLIRHLYHRPKLTSWMQVVLPRLLKRPMLRPSRSTRTTWFSRPRLHSFILTSPPVPIHYLAQALPSARCFWHKGRADTASIAGSRGRSWPGHL